MQLLSEPNRGSTSHTPTESALHLGELRGLGSFCQILAATPTLHSEPGSGRAQLSDRQGVLLPIPSPVPTSQWRAEPVAGRLPHSPRGHSLQAISLQLESRGSSGSKPQAQKELSELQRLQDEALPVLGPKPSPSFRQNQFPPSPLPPPPLSPPKPLHLVLSPSWFLWSSHASRRKYGPRRAQNRQKSCIETKLYHSQFNLLQTTKHPVRVRQRC